MTSKLLLKSTPPYAALALAITSQDWTSLGDESDPSVAPSSDLELTVERVTALLLIRIVAIHAPKEKYQDLSTTTICRTSLMAGKDWAEPITDNVIAALRGYVRRILKQYQEVPYHNMEHAYHVIVSTNKLLDLALNSEIQKEGEKPLMYGLREDPLLHFLLLFSALVHDVEHRGIPNRQLAMEDDELAILYNDQSIAENRSLTIAFRELLKNDYANLKKAIFINDEEYRRFRKYTTQIVLQTDLASPERTQIRKSKWKEAFGEEFETVERKVRHALSRRASQATAGGQSRRASAAEILCEMEELPEPESLTATPEGSESGEQDIQELDKSLMEQSLNDHDDPLSKPIPGIARSSITSKSQRGSVARTASMPEKKRPSGVPGDEALGYTVSESFRKFQRRISAHGGRQRRYHRLGISRSIDLSGEFIETYSRGSAHSAMANMKSFDEELDQDENEQGESAEEPDELKISVILEQILTAADIAHNLQGFFQMEKFSKRLYLELKKAHKEGRGPDPSEGWYNNQIAFLESYLLPLAQRMEDCGIFGPVVGPAFAQIVEANRDEWLERGQEVTKETIAKGHELFPTD